MVRVHPLVPLFAAEAYPVMRPPCKRENRVQVLVAALFLPWCKVARLAYTQLALDEGAARVRVPAGGRLLAP